MCGSVMQWEQKKVGRSEKCRFCQSTAKLKTGNRTVTITCTVGTSREYSRLAL